MRGYCVVGIEGLKLTEKETEQLKHPAIAGVILFARNYESIEQLQALNHAIKTINSELFICVDQEGGRVQRFREGFTTLPSLGSIGDVYKTDPEHAIKVAYSAGLVMAYELVGCGIDFSFTPVLDLNRELNDVIGRRSFSVSADIIYTLASELCRGIKRCNMPTIGKHFPGHGGVCEDTHTDSATDARDIELLNEDMFPFAQLIEQNLIDGVMPAHIVYSAVDNQLAGFSSHWLKNVLMQELQFNGAIFSDDLNMQAAKNADGLMGATEKALQAGCHFVLVCNELDEVPALLNNLDVSNIIVNDYKFDWQKVNRDGISKDEYLGALEQIKNI